MLTRQLQLPVELTARPGGGSGLVGARGAEAPVGPALSTRAASLTPCLGSGPLYTEQLLRTPQSFCPCGFYLSVRTVLSMKTGSI